MSEQTPLPPAVRGVATAPVTAYARPAAQGLNRRWRTFRRSMRRSGALLLMALPGIIHLFVFSYLPMPELLLAFKDYKFARGIWGSAWVEFRNFQFLFATGDAWRIIFNTLFLNTLFILTTLVGALTMAVLLHEIYHRYVAKIYQSILFFRTLTEIQRQVDAWAQTNVAQQ